VIVQIDAGCFALSAIPLKDKSPLLVHPDRMKGGKIAAQFLEVIARRDTQILIRRRIVDHLEFAEQAVFEIGRDFL
jgi:hypothetical protein